MGLIRISDEAEAKIKDLAASSGRTVTSTVDTLVQSNDVAARLNKMGAWLEKKFEDLEAAIALTSVSTPSHKRLTRKKKIVPFDIIQELIFDYLEEGAPEWRAGAEEGAHASDYLELNTWYTDGAVITSDGPFGTNEWMDVSPRVKTFLEEKGIVLD